MTTGFQSEMTRLRRDLLAMAATVEQRLHRALNAAVNHDPDLALTVRKGDREVDVMELDIDGECVRLLALYAPVARDLRFILATLRINQELERIADLAKGISKRTIHLSQLTTVEYPPHLVEMAELARTMYANVISALSNEDVTMAEHVRVADKDIDDRDKLMSLWVVTELPARGADPRIAPDILTISRAIERIGDLCTNVAEEIIFAVGGRVVRHTDAVAPVEE